MRLANFTPPTAVPVAKLLSLGLKGEGPIMRLSKFGIVNVVSKATGENPELPPPL